MGPSTACFCGHRFRQHATDHVRGKQRHARDVRCTEPGCRCQLFEFLPSHGTWAVKCTCKHDAARAENPPPCCPPQRTQRTQRTGAPSFSSHSRPEIEPTRGAEPRESPQNPNPPPPRATGGPRPADPPLPQRGELRLRRVHLELLLLLRAALARIDIPRALTFHAPPRHSGLASPPLPPRSGGRKAAGARLFQPPLLHPNVAHTRSAHSTVFESRDDRVAAGRPVDNLAGGGAAYEAVGAVTSFAALADGYERAELGDPRLPFTEAMGRLRVEDPAGAAALAAAAEGRGPPPGKCAGAGAALSRACLALSRGGISKPTLPRSARGGITDAGATRICS